MIVKPKKIMVVSHERSGTHFLMNTLANNFGFQSHPWVDLDNPIWLPYVPQNIGRELLLIAQNNETEMAIVKSHHNVKFFEGILDDISKLYHIFYIYRDREDTLRSCWKHFKDIREKQNWNGGPYCQTYEEFKRSEPYAACMRYQYQQYPTMEERYNDHVKGWLEQGNVITVKYEDLNEDFNKTVMTIKDRIGLAMFHGEPLRPTKGKTIQDGMFNEMDVAI